MVVVLIINTNLPVPSTWSRSGNAVATVPVTGGEYPAKLIQRMKYRHLN
jgi:hypothetical protein